MPLEIIKRELTACCRGIGVPDSSQITKFRGKFTTKLNLQSNAPTKKNVIEISSQ